MTGKVVCLWIGGSWYWQVLCLRVSLQGDHEANGFDEDDWGDDVTEEAVRKRMENISVAARGMTHTDDLEKSQLERGNIFYKFIKVEL